MLPPLFFPYDIEDPVECFNIRVRRSPYIPALPYPPIPENTADSVYELFRVSIKRTFCAVRDCVSIWVRVHPKVKILS